MSMADMRTLGDLLEAGVIEATNGFPFGGHNSDGTGIPHIRPFNVATNGEITLEQIKSVPLDVADGRPRLRHGDIVFNNTNTKELVGKCAVWDQETAPVFSNHMTRIRVNTTTCDPDFLSFAILHHWITGKSEMLARAHVAQASIMGERLREIEVPWPALGVQRNIAQILARVRAARRSDERQQEQALRVKHAVMRELFTRGLGSEGQKETAIGPVPEAWNVEALGAHHTVVSGGTPSRSNSEFWNAGSIPWVKTTEVDYCVINETEEHITHAGLAGSAAKLLQPGTLLMAMYGQGVTRGKVAILGIEAACNQACAAITPSDDSMLPRYLYHFLTWRYDAIRSLAHGGQQQNLNLEIVRDLLVAYPASREEQLAVVSILDALDRKIDLHRKKRSVLATLFTTLVQGLMTSDLRVDHLDLSALSRAPEAAA